MKLGRSNLSPIIDIHPPSPSIKRTLTGGKLPIRELAQSTKLSISRASHSKECWQHTTVEGSSRWRSWLALLTF